jgi:O-antigen/teichoic acid export membrane protein
MDTLLIREVAASHDQDPPHSCAEISTTLTMALIIQLFLAVVIIVVIGLGASRLPNQTATTLLSFHLASLALLPLAFSTVYSAYLRGHERMDLYLLFTLISGLLMAAGVAVVLYFDGRLPSLSLLLLSSHVAGALLAAHLCRRFLPSLSFRLHSLKQRAIVPMIKTGFVLGALTALAVIYQRTGTLTLSLLLGDAPTGWYSAAARITEAVKMVPYALFGAMFPIMARRAARTKQFPTKLPNLSISQSLISSLHKPLLKAHALYDFSFLLLLAFSGGAAVLLTLLARPLVEMLYGLAYAPSVGALRILAWGLLPAVATLRLSFDLVTTGRERIALAATAVTLVLTVVVVWALTRWYGLEGTCAAVVGCEALQALIFFLFSRRTDTPS